jgi:hypothetical protein
VKGLLIALAVIAVLLVGADRAADFAAGRYAADRIAEQTQSVGAVSVDFRGFPFLTQAVRRTFGQVDVSASDAEAGGVRVERLDARLNDVRLLSRNAARAGSLTGRATMTYQELTDATQGEAQISYGGDDLIKVSRTVTVLGRQATVSAVGRVSVRDGVLTIRPVRFDGGGGPVSDAVRRLSLQPFAVDVPVPQLPGGIDVVAVRPAETGVELRVTGTDVLLQP